MKYWQRQISDVFAAPSGIQESVPCARYASYGEVVVTMRVLAPHGMSSWEAKSLDPKTVKAPPACLYLDVSHGYIPSRPYLRQPFGFGGLEGNTGKRRPSPDSGLVEIQGSRDGWNPVYARPYDTQRKILGVNRLTSSERINYFSTAVGPGLKKLRDKGEALDALSEVQDALYFCSTSH